MIRIIFLVIVVSLMTWLILDNYYYSPKAQIKRLWKRVHKFSEFISVLEESNLPSYTSDSTKAEKRKLGRLINSLLDCHFDKEKEEDVNYIKDYKYVDDFIKNEEFILEKVKKIYIQEEDWDKIDKLLKNN